MSDDKPMTDLDTMKADMAVLALYGAEGSVWADPYDVAMFKRIHDYLSARLADAEQPSRMREALERISKLTPAAANARTAQDLHGTVKVIADCALADAEQPAVAGDMPWDERRNRIIGALIDYRDAAPEEDESWESWYYAAFDMAMEKIAGLLDGAALPAERAAPTAQPVAGDGGLRIEDEALLSRCYLAMRDAMGVIDANEGPGFKHSKILSSLASARVDIERRPAARAALSTSVPAGVVDGWLPIKTAPKDGTKVDLWIVWSDGGRRAADARYDEENCDWRTAGDFLLYQYLDRPTATHWRREPAPPAQDPTR